MNKCAYRGVQSLLATTLASGGGLQIPRIMGSGMGCDKSLLLNFRLSLGAYAQPISVPDLTVMVIVGIRTLVATPTLFGHSDLSNLESAL